MKVDGGVGRWVGGSVAIFIYTSQCIIFDKETCYLRVFKKAVAKLFDFTKETRVRERTPRATEWTPSLDTRDVNLDITMSSENLVKVRNGYLRGILFMHCIFLTVYSFLHSRN